MKAITNHNSVTFKDHISIDAGTEQNPLLSDQQVLSPVLILHDVAPSSKTQAQAWSDLPTLTVEPLNTQLSMLRTQSSEPMVSAVIVCASEAHPEVVTELGILTTECGIPSLLCVANHDENLVSSIVDAGISAYHIGTMSLVQLTAAIAFAHHQVKATQQLKQLLSEAQAKLQARKVIERAKGLLMQQNGVSEDEAYKQLRSSAMNKGMPMDKLALRIISVFEQYGPVEPTAQKSLTA